MAVIPAGIETQTPAADYLWPGKLVFHYSTSPINKSIMKNRYILIKISVEYGGTG
jgi:hypothetical protein